MAEGQPTLWYPSQGVPRHVRITHFLSRPLKLDLFPNHPIWTKEPSSQDDPIVVKCSVLALVGLLAAIYCSLVLGEFPVVGCGGWLGLVHEFSVRPVQGVQYLSQLLSMFGGIQGTVWRYT